MVDTGIIKLESRVDPSHGGKTGICVCGFVCVCAYCLEHVVKSVCV